MTKNAKKTVETQPNEEVKLNAIGGLLGTDDERAQFDQVKQLLEIANAPSRGVTIIVSPVGAMTFNTVGRFEADELIGVFTTAIQYITKQQAEQRTKQQANAIPPAAQPAEQPTAQQSE